MSEARAELEPEFRRLYGAHGRDLMTYALRRTNTPEDAADIVAETILVAWRKVGQIPSGEEARLWLFGVARLVLANHLRGSAAAVGLRSGCAAKSPRRWRASRAPSPRAR
ncbi:MAG TPA: sigma factor [Solirubrobacterales bacterium]|nr:sigma factor [Solirubrobacterales bacterium]